MLKKIDTFLFGNIPFSCESKYSLEDSIIRLNNATKRSVFSSLTKQNAVGKISASKVNLQRVAPFFGNSFKPIFIGKFQTENGKIFLNGKFTTFLLSKVFMAIWFSFALFWTSLAIKQVITVLGTTSNRFEIEPIVFLFPTFGFLFIAIGILFIKLCWRFSLKDMDYLKKVIIGALTENS